MSQSRLSAGGAWDKRHIHHLGLPRSEGPSTQAQLPRASAGGAALLRARRPRGGGAAARPDAAAGGQGVSVSDGRRGEASGAL